MRSCSGLRAIEATGAQRSSTPPAVEVYEGFGIAHSGRASHRIIPTYVIIIVYPACTLGAPSYVTVATDFNSQHGGESHNIPSGARYAQI